MSELVKNLRKEENKKKNGLKRTKSLLKLRLDVNDRPEKMIEKTINFLAKDLKDVNLEENLHKIFKFSNFEVKFENCEKEDLKKLLNYKFNKNNRIQEIVKVKISDSNNEIIVYSSLFFKIPKSFLGRFWRVEDEKIYAIDISHIYGALKLMDMITKELSVRESYFNKSFQKISIFDKAYDSKLKGIVPKIILESKLTFFLFKSSKIGKTYFYDCLKLIVDSIVIMQAVNSNVELSNAYDEQSKKECARAFETKKNIPPKIIAKMKKTILLNDFSYVEIDEDTDIKKFEIIEKEWCKFKEANIKKYMKKKPELRFKKLGKHRANGIFVPHINCICIETLSPCSFFHEFLHFVDYNLEEFEQLSLQEEFFGIISLYKKCYFNYLKENKNEYLARKTGYFFTPTEIFARTGEFFVLSKGIKSSFIHEKEELNPNIGFIPFSEELQEMIKEYFEKFFGALDFKILETIKTEKTVKVKKSIKLDEEFKLGEQLSLAI